MKWLLTPEGDLINMERVKMIRVNGDFVEFDFELDYFKNFELTAKWKKILKTLPNELNGDD